MNNINNLIKVGVRLVGDVLAVAGTHGVCARDRNGKEVFSTNKQATCWCATGASSMIAHKMNIGWNGVDRVSDELARSLGFESNVDAWENGTPEQLNEFIRLHKTYTGE